MEVGSGLDASMGSAAAGGSSSPVPPPLTPGTAMNPRVSASSSASRRRAMVARRTEK